MMNRRSGSHIKWTYDAQDRCITDFNADSERTTITWDALDRFQRVTLGNSVTLSHSYDAAGRETLIENRTSAGVALSVYTASYDGIGNRLTVLELDGTRVTYGYDSSYQLINERRSGANAYNVTLAYDPVGNRLVKSDGAQLTSCSYNAGNELTLITNPSGAPTTQSFDSNGNMTLQSTGAALTTYAWDSEDRLLTVSASTGIETYTYSADGLRQKKVAGATTAFYLRDGENVAQEANASLINTVRNTDLPGIWGGKFAVRQSGGSNFYVPDFQGHTRQLTNTSQTVTDTLLLDAWGKEIASTGTTVNPYRSFGQFGYFRDLATRLYVQARHYDVANGRWFSRDPLGFFGGDANLYRNVSNMPTGDCDPSGLQIAGDLVPAAGGGASCGAIFNCLNDPARENCRGKGIPQSRNSELMVCLLWHETCFGMSASPKVPGSGYFGGLGNCGKDCFDQIRFQESNCKWLSKFKDYLDFRNKATDCEKVRAAQDFLGSDYIRKKGFVGFGPSPRDEPKGAYSNPGVVARFRRCAADLSQVPSRLYLACRHYDFPFAGPEHGKAFDSLCMEVLRREKKCPQISGPISPTGLVLRFGITRSVASKSQFALWPRLSRFRPR